MYLLRYSTKIGELDAPTCELGGNTGLHHGTTVEGRICFQ